MGSDHTHLLRRRPAGDDGVPGVQETMEHRPRDGLQILLAAKQRRWDVKPRIVEVVVQFKTTHLASELLYEVRHVLRRGTLTHAVRPRLEFSRVVEVREPKRRAAPGKGKGI